MHISFVEAENSGSSLRAGVTKANSRVCAHAPAMHFPSSSACEAPPFDLKHREVNHAVVNFATRESGASDTLKFCPMPVEIAERLALRRKRRRKTAHLP